MKVPFLDLKAQYDSIKPEIDKAIKEVIDNTAFVLGPSVQRFEENFAEFCNAKYAIGVNSGTAALHLALLSLGVEPEDEVITVPNTFIATAEAISHCGATPIFVDVNEYTYTMDYTKLEEKINSKTKVIIPVHLYGRPADMERVNELAKKYNIKVLEDACQAHGAEYKNERVGSLTDISAFSFYPGKNLGAYGEGGMIVTNDKELAKKCKLLRAHGEYPKNIHSIIGYNYRMDGMQGAILNVKLKYLNQWNEARKDKAKIYNKLLDGIEGITLPIMYDDDIYDSVFHLYVIRIKDRESLREFLQSKDIATGIHYEFPIHLQGAYKNLGLVEGDYPISEKCMSEIVSLPIFPELTEEQIEYVCESIKEWKNGT